MPHAERFHARLLADRDRLGRLIGRQRQNVTDAVHVGVNEAWHTTPRARAEGFVSNSGDDEYADAASDTFAKEMDLTMLSRHRHRLATVESALARIEEGTYGTCLRCHQKIGVGRLEAIPETPYCRDCEQDVEVQG